MKHVVKGLLSVAILALVMWAAWQKYNTFLTQGSRPTEGTRILNKMEKEGVPQFTLPNLEGEPISLSDFKDQVVIINFWASWCDPCVEEFPSLINLINKFDGKIILLAVSGDHNMDDLKTFLKAFKVESPHIKVMWDKDLKVAQSYGTQVLPESYILGRNNRLIRKIAGVDKWDTPDAFAFFESLLKP